MSVKCSAYLAASLDGFIARPDGDVAWLHRPEYSPMGEGGLSYEDFIRTVDLLVVGRRSFEKVLTFGGWPYEGTPVVVLTNHGVDIPEALSGKVRVAAGSPAELVGRFETEGRKHLYVDGGDTIQRFLRARLLDEITITWIPVLLGDGIPLFGSLDGDVHLRHLETATLQNGFVQTRYRIDR